MASRIDYSQNRRLYVGTTAEVTLADGNALIAGKLGIGTGSFGSVLSVEGNQNLVSLKRGTSGDQTFFMSADSARLYFSHTDTQSSNLILTLYDNKNAVFSGNVGIGVTGPSGRLHVADDDGPTSLYMTNTDTAQTGTGSVQNQIIMKGLYWSGSSSQLIETRINSVHQLANGNGGSALTFMTQTGGSGAVEQMRIDRDGNVGIGITDPDQALEIGAAGKLKLSRSDNARSMILYTDGSYGTIETDVDPILVKSANRIDFQIDGSTEAMRIALDQNVGINTTTAQVRLEVKSANHSEFAAHFGQGQVNSSGVFGGISLGYTEANTSYRKVALVAKALGDGAARQNLHFLVDIANDGGSASLADTKMMINGLTGKIGIGTSDPTGNLNVESTGNQFHLRASTATAGKFWNFDVTSNNQLFIINNGNVGMTIKDSGNVGIGNTGATAKLEVTGETFVKTSNGVSDLYLGNHGTPNLLANRFARFHTNNTDTYFDMNCGVVYWRQLNATRFQNNMNNGTLTASGDMIAYGSPSDIRLKENIKPIESALDKVMKLEGVTFDWKENDSILDIKEDIGFIAQDVQKIVPELVRENEDGMLSMRHQGIAPILLEAIKELKAEIEELKKQIK
jgi:hypothetical protein